MGSEFVLSLRMENSHIEWTDHTWNPWIGCTKVDELCAHCYAEARDIRFSEGKHWGKGAPRQRTSVGNWKEPYRWNATAKEEQFRIKSETRSEFDAVDYHRPRVFCASLADWLDEEVPTEWLADMLIVVNDCQNLDWLLLSKRPEKWRERITAANAILGDRGRGGDDNATAAFIMTDEWLSGHVGPPNNIWMGTSVGTQKSADKRIPELLAIPARVRFLSCEPLLGPVDLMYPESLYPGGPPRCCNGHECGCMGQPTEPPLIYGINWVICGGESGKGARPMHPNWARSLRDQCRDANVPFFFKQWGEHSAEFRPGVEVVMDALAPNQAVAWGDGETNHVLYTRVGKKSAGRVLDGREWNEVPS